MIMGNLFWEENYKGHHIAMLQSEGFFYVYINKQLMAGVAFPAGATAKQWLREQIDTKIKRAEKTKSVKIPKKVS
jgi:hypothetical protein